jgi:hypothetical protein
MSDYRAHPALNFSLAKHMLRSPAHFQAARAHPEPETKAMLIGTVLHAVILEFRPLASMVAVRPPGLSLVTKEGKAWRSANPGPEITDQEAADITAMAQSILASEIAVSALVAAPQREVELYATMRGIECKAKLDAIGRAWDGAPIIIDIKTTDDVSPDAFRRTIVQRRYEMQAAWYCDLAANALGWDEEPRFAWIVVEKAPPYAVAVYECGGDFMDSGRDMCRRAIETYRHCADSGEWPGPADGWNIIQPPSWYAYRNERGEG